MCARTGHGGPERIDDVLDEPAEFRDRLPQTWLGKPSRQALIAEEMRRLNASAAASGQADGAVPGPANGADSGPTPADGTNPTTAAATTPA